MHVFRKKGMGWNRLFLLQGGRKNFWYCTALKGERNKKNESWKFFNRLVTEATIDSLDRYCNLESIFWKRSWIRSFKNFDSASLRVWLDFKLYNINQTLQADSPRKTSHSGQVMYYDPPVNQPFDIIQKIFNRNDPYIILYQNFKIVVLRAGCAQLCFSEFRAENGT